MFTYLYLPVSVCGGPYVRIITEVQHVHYTQCCQIHGDDHVTSLFYAYHVPLHSFSSHRNLLLSLRVASAFMGIKITNFCDCRLVQLPFSSFVDIHL